LSTQGSASFRNIRLRLRGSRFEPPPPDDSLWTDWQPLFDGKSLDGWEVVNQTGHVTVSDGVLTLDAQNATQKALVAPTVDVPEIDYELSLDVMRKEGKGLCNVYFPIGKQRTRLDIAGFDDGVVGLSTVDGDLAHKNCQRRLTPKDGQWYHLRFRVTATQIRLWIDDETFVKIPVAGHRFAAHNPESERPLVLAVYETQTCFRNIRIRRHKPLPWTIYSQWPFDAAEARRRQAETAKALGVEVEKTFELSQGTRLTMVLIPAGEFIMGDSRIQSVTRRDFVDSKYSRGRPRPAHRVTLTRPYLLGKCEVTQEQRRAVMNTSPSSRAGDQHPVETISWEDAQGFVAALNKMAQGGLTFRLPTEAEWEHACRAGTTTRFYFGDSPDDLDAYAWHGGNSGKKTHPIGGKLPNPWGLHGLYGNVSEWCQDGFSPYAEHWQIDPLAEAENNAPRDRVSRGKDWYNDRSEEFSSTQRGRNRTSQRVNNLGIRLAADLHEVLRSAPRRP